MHRLDLAVPGVVKSHLQHGGNNRCHGRHVDIKEFEYDEKDDDGKYVVEEFHGINSV
jgi:hypothetical protein